MREKKLTERQEAFIREYLVDLNATQAAIRAGYSKKTAKETGYENLTKPHIQKAIADAIEKRSERTEITQDWIISKLVLNVERAMQAEPVRDRGGNPTGEYVYHGSAANKALELLGKHLGMFKDRLEVELSGFNLADYSYDQLLEIRERMAKNEPITIILATLESK